MSEIMDGDFSVDQHASKLDRRRRVLRPGPWSWFRQVHGSDVLLVEEPGALSGQKADGAVTTQPGINLSIQIADCAPVALASPGGVAVVHAGWRGLSAGILEKASKKLSDVAPGPQLAVLGPCIHPCCYEFAAEELEDLELKFGYLARGKTRDGQLALDIPAVVRSILKTPLVVEFLEDDTCTGCDSRYWSYRVDGVEHRQTFVAWMEW